MAAISPPHGVGFPMRRNLSSICRPGSIRILIRCRNFRPSCLPGCRSRPRWNVWPQSPRAPMARNRRTRWRRRRARRSCCRPVFALVPAGRAAVLGPTYAEHARVADARRAPDQRKQTDLGGPQGRRSRRRRQSEQSGRPHRGQGRAARAGRRETAARRPAGGRRSLHGCGPGRPEPRSRGRARPHRGAAVVREVLRAGRPAARLRAGRAGTCGAASGDARALGGGRAGHRGRPGRLSDAAWAEAMRGHAGPRSRRGSTTC